MKRVYLDNGSTSYPKAPGVGQAVFDFIENIGTNVNRGGYEAAYAAEDVIIETREMLCKMFHFDKIKNVIFTPSITYSLNYIIKGYLRAGDHVLVSAMEHNAMMRPLTQMLEHGVEFDRVPCNQQGELLIDQMEGMIRPNTKAVLMLHASNVCGTLMPVEQVGQLCKKHGLTFILDAAQTAGAFPIDMEKMNIDVLTFTGHKSLLGPQGIGGFLVSDEVAQQMIPLVTGGTGSVSGSSVRIVRIRISPLRTAVMFLGVSPMVSTAAKLSPQPVSSRSGKRSAALSPVTSAPNNRHAAGLENTMRPCAMPQTASRLSRNSGASAAPEISTFSISAVFPFCAGLLPVSYHKFCGVDTTIFCFLRSFGVRRCFLYIFTN